jgi:hypothetical protein
LDLNPTMLPLICSLLDAFLLLYRSGGFTTEPGLLAEHAMEFQLYAMRERWVYHSSKSEPISINNRNGCFSTLSTDLLLFSTILKMRISQVLIPLSAGIAAASDRSAKPNFVLIITDDQDLHLNSLNYQPSVQKHFAQEGTWFKKHFCTVALCCPSRVSFLTGKAAHNTNVTDVSAPYGTTKTGLRTCRWTLIVPRWLS